MAEIAPVKSIPAPEPLVSDVTVEEVDPVEAKGLTKVPAVAAYMEAETAPEPMTKTPSALAISAYSCCTSDVCNDPS